jgi:DHA1 family tetracycline resistance protein-like MFS transporter
VILRLLPILGITFIDILGFSILIPLMPFFVEHFGAPPIVVGTLFAVFALCQLVAGPVWGNISDRIGRKAVLIVSQIGATIGWTMLALAPNLGIVFLARIIEGLSGGNMSVTQAYVADVVEPEKRARAFALIGASFSLGLIFGPAAGGWLAGHFGFSAPFLLAAGLQLVTLVVTVAVLPESRQTGAISETAGVREIVKSLRDPRLAPTMWQKLVYSFGLYGWFAAFTLVLQAQLGLTQETASYFFAAFGVVSVVMQLGVVGRITDLLGDRQTSNLGLAAVFGSLVIAPFIHDLRLAFVMLVLFSFGLSINNATLPALITEVTPENQRGSILGVASSLESASGIVMPPISTGAFGLYGVGATAAISAAFTVAALAMGLLQSRRPASAVSSRLR